MLEDDYNPPVFPVQAGNGLPIPGMTLRDHFAGLAMQAMINALFLDNRDPEIVTDDLGIERLALSLTAYDCADAMLFARKGALRGGE